MVTVIVYGILAVSSNVSGTSSYVIASQTTVGLIDFGPPLQTLMEMKRLCQTKQEWCCRNNQTPFWY